MVSRTVVPWKQIFNIVSLSVWCGMIDDMLIGPIILVDHMRGQKYLDFNIPC
jgi:hypothetical protein